jgi:hypothetical protein
VTDPLFELQAALDGLAAALTSGDPDAVLAAETPLAIATARLTALDGRPDGTAAELRARLQDIRRSVGRCRRLGAASADLLNLFTAAEYGPAGRTRGRSSRSARELER